MNILRNLLDVALFPAKVILRLFGFLLFIESLVYAVKKENKTNEVAV